MKRHDCKNYIKKCTLKVIFYVTTMGWIILIQTALLYTQQLKCCVYIKLNKREGRAGKKEEQFSEVAKNKKTGEANNTLRLTVGGVTGTEERKRIWDESLRSGKKKSQNENRRAENRRFNGLDGRKNRVEWTEQVEEDSQAGLRTVNLKKDYF